MTEGRVPVTSEHKTGEMRENVDNWEDSQPLS